MTRLTQKRVCNIHLLPPYMTNLEITNIVYSNIFKIKKRKKNNKIRGRIKTEQKQIKIMLKE